MNKEESGTWWWCGYFCKNKVSVMAILVPMKKIHWLHFASLLTLSSCDPLINFHYNFKMSQPMWKGVLITQTNSEGSDPASVSAEPHNKMKLEKASDKKPEPQWMTAHAFTERTMLSSNFFWNGPNSHTATEFFSNKVKGLIHDHFLVQVSMIIFSMTFYLIVYHAKNDHFLYCTRKWWD